MRSTFPRTLTIRSWTRVSVCSLRSGYTHEIHIPPDFNDTFVNPRVCVFTQIRVHFMRSTFPRTLTTRSSTWGWARCWRTWVRISLSRWPAGESTTPTSAPCWTRCARTPTGPSPRTLPSTPSTPAPTTTSGTSSTTPRPRGWTWPWCRLGYELSDG